MSADSEVSKPKDPQDLNRYSYVHNNPVRYTDPSGHDWNDVVSVAAGFVTQVAANNSWWNAQAHEALSARPGESGWETAGRLLGDAATAVQGASEGALGAGGITGGVGLCATGVGCLLGAPAIVGSAVLAGHGASVAAAGGINAGLLLSQVLSAGTGGSHSLPRWNANRSGHIFDSTKTGHLYSTNPTVLDQYIRTFQDVAANPNNLRTNYLPADAVQAGVQAYTEVTSQGQVWVYVRNGEIVDAGLNLAGAFR